MTDLLPPLHYFSPPRLLRPFYPLPSNLLFNTCFTTSSSLSSSLSPSFSILTPSQKRRGGKKEEDEDDGGEKNTEKVIRKS
jgi:hypothetical protein